MEKEIVRLTGLFGGLLAFAALAFFSDGSPFWLLGAMMALMVTWWVTEAVPLPATALVPLVLLPLLGLSPLAEVSSNYTRPIILLMFAGLTLALAIERANLHVRIVVGILRLTGDHVHGVIFGFMLSAFLLSMWLSNTATTAAMLPIALSFITLLSKPGASPTDLSPGDKKLALTILLGIAYAANIGGTATLIGTAPNALTAAGLNARFGIDIDFLTWMLMVLPWSLAMLVVMWFVMTRFLFRGATSNLENMIDVLEAKEEELGAVSHLEKCVAVMFGLTVLLMIFYRFIPLANLSYTLIGLFAVVCAFAVPIKLKPLTFMLDWDDMKKLPWGILILLGGGLALGDSMTRTGLSSVIGDEVLAGSGWLGENIWIAFAVLAMGLTEFASNTAMTATLLPVVFDVAEKIGANPAFFAIPMTLGTSCAFMMPIATPPTALVFASGYIRVGDMARAGIWMNIIALVLMVLVLSWSIPLFF